MTPEQSPALTTLSAVGELDFLSRFDDSILKYSDGYCLFDASNKLSAYSDNFLTLYPALGDELELGIGYEAYLQLLYRTNACLLYTSPSPRDGLLSRMPSSA